MFEQEDQSVEENNQLYFVIDMEENQSSEETMNEQTPPILQRMNSTSPYDLDPPYYLDSIPEESLFDHSQWIHYDVAH